MLIGSGIALLAIGVVGVVADQDDPAAAGATADPTDGDVPASAEPSDPPPEDPPVETPEEFFSALAEAFRSADDDFLFERLHPAVTDRYGTRTCRRALDVDPDKSAAFAVEVVEEPAPFEWTSDSRTDIIPDVLTATLTRTIKGEASVSEAHVAYVDDQLRWFTDCGEPLT